MTQKSKKIISIMGDEKVDKPIIDLLRIKYEVEEIIGLKDFLTTAETAIEEERRIEDTPDIVIINGENKPLVKELFYILTDSYYRISSKLIGFGEGAIFLGELNNAIVLEGITNHKDTTHLTTFCMPDEKLLDFTVKSNHEKLLFPTHKNYEILAFSTHNLSNSYTDVKKGVTFKAERNFLELEAIKFNGTDSYCFMYNVPTLKESILIDLTTQFLNR